MTQRISLLIQGTFCLALLTPGTLQAQRFDPRHFLADFIVVQQEEAEAKRIRLDWITKERERIHGELQNYGKELAELNAILPDPVRPRVLAPAPALARFRERIAFNDFSDNNNPALNGAVRSGSAINALVRVLGPIAHCRKMRSAVQLQSPSFPSLADSSRILASEAVHFRLSSGSVTNTNVVHRLNQSPLELDWPPVLVTDWPVECRDVSKLRDEYVMLLKSTAARDAGKRAERAEVLDSALELMQAMVLREKNRTPHNLTLTPQKKMVRQGELRQALNYLMMVRASAEEFKQAPSQFMVHEFAGGTIEDFLDFCYTRGMIFKEAQPDDRAAYFTVYRKMQDYAQDIQHIEDWKDDLRHGIQALNEEDRDLVIRASTQLPFDIIVD